MIKNLILEKLKNANDYISGESLSNDLNVSRTAVWKAVKSLRDDGFIISAVTNKGYILKNKDLTILSSYEIKKGLSTKILGKDILILYSVTSTNEYIKKYTKKNGFVIISKKQTKGKAKNKTEFASQNEGMYMSIVFNPKSISIDKLTIIKSGIIKSIKNSLSFINNITVKDNEIFMSDKKVGGILTNIEIESESETVQNIITGVGLYKNCYSDTINEIKIICNILNNLDSFFYSIDLIKE